MAISNSLDQRQFQSYVESTTVSNAPVLRVGNADGTNIGGTITAIIPGTGATNLGKAIDSPQGPTDTGVAFLVVRDDSLSSITPAEGDYTTLLVDNQGALWIRSASPINLNANKQDDSAFSIGSDSVFPSGLLVDDTASDSVDEGDTGIPRMSSDRITYVRQNPPTTTHTTTSSSVGDSATSVTILTSNSARTGYKVRNDSTAVMYIEEGATATTSSVIRLESQGYYESQILTGGEVYRGIVTAIWASDAGGNARISESV